MQIKLYSPLGVETLLEVPEGRTARETHQNALKIQREYGAIGYHPPLTAGGLRLPLAQEATFDWRLVGARAPKEFASEGSKKSTKILAGGFWYTRRELKSDDQKNMDVAVRYSRGAKDFESENIQPTANSKIGQGYITLVTFSGEGRIQDDYNKPAHESRQGGASRRGNGPNRNVNANDLPSQDPIDAVIERIKTMASEIFPALPKAELLDRVAKGAREKLEFEIPNGAALNDQNPETLGRIIGFLTEVLDETRRKRTTHTGK